MMNLQTAHVFVRDALDSEYRVVIQSLADDDLAGSSGGFTTCLDGIHAATYRDVELTLDTLGNLDAPL